MTKIEKAVLKAAEWFFWGWRPMSGAVGPLSKAQWLESSVVPGECDHHDAALIRAVRAHLRSKQGKGGK